MPDEVGKFRKGERSVRKGKENFGKLREKKSECVSVRSLQEKEEIIVSRNIFGGRERERERRNRQKAMDAGK